MVHRAAIPFLIAALSASRFAAAADGPQPIPVADLSRATPVNFEKEILPALAANCLACHNRTKAKADLVLETPADILKGGENGPAVVPKRSADSLLLKSAAHRVEPVMPPKNNKVAAADLTPDQLGLIRLWIDQGAAGEVHASTADMTWQPLPAGLNAVYAAGVSPDGLLAACSRGNRVFLYRLPSRQRLAQLRDPCPGATPHAPGAADGIPPAAHRDVVQALAFSPDGGLLATGGYREIKLWRRPRDVRKFSITSAGPVDRVAASPDGKVFATAGPDGVIHLWDAATSGSRAAFALAGHAGPVRSLRFSPDGLRLASVGADDTLRLWGVTDGAPLSRASLPAGTTSIAWVGGGRRLVTGGADGVLRVWAVPDAPGGEFAAPSEVRGHDGPITCLDSAPAAPARVVSGGADGSVRVWDLDAGKAVWRADHGSPVSAVAARADGKRFASAGSNPAGRLWDADGKPLAELKGEFYASEGARQAGRDAALAAAEAAFRKAAVEAAAKQHAGEVARVKKAAVAVVEADKALAEKRKAAAAAAADAKAAAEAEAKKLEAAGAAGEDELRLAIKSAQQAADALAEAAGAAQSAEAERKKLQDDLPAATAAAAAAEKPARDVAFSADGLTVATAGDDGSVHAWGAETGAAVDTFKGHAGAASSLAFVAGNVIVSGSSDGAAGWDLCPAWPLERVIGSGDGASPIADRVNALDFSPDGRTLAAGGGVPSREGEITVWDVAGGALVRRLDRVHSDTVLGLAFSPDGKRLASAGADRFVKVTDAADGKVLKTFEGHGGHVLSVAWRRDGRALASGSADNSVKLWDAAAGAQTKTVQGFDKEVTCVRFLGDTDQVLATAGDGKVRLLRPDGGEVRGFGGAAGFVYAAAAGRDGATVVAGGEDGVLRLWEAATAKELFKFGPPE